MKLHDFVNIALKVVVPVKTCIWKNIEWINKWYLYYDIIEMTSYQVQFVIPVGNCTFERHKTVQQDFWKTMHHKGSCYVRDKSPLLGWKFGSVKKKLVN